MSNYDPAEARQGNVVAWEPWVEDAKAFARFVKARTPRGVPIFLHGQSFGTIVAIPALLESEREVRWRGLILQSPAIGMMRPKFSPSAALAATLLPSYRVAQLKMIEDDHLKLTTDDAFNCRWLHSTDRVAAGYTVRSLKLSVSLGDVAWRAAPRLDVPVLALRGERDGLAGGLEQPYEEFLTQRLPAPPQTTVKRYPAGGHLLTGGFEKPTVIRDIVRWLDQRS